MSQLIPHSDPLLAHLDDCGACRGVEVTTPLAVYNRPGLEELRYRIGQHSSFFSSLIARLTTLCEGSPKDCQGGTGTHPLRDKLTIRNPDDPAIALLDAWSVVGDILTFYQERIANEGYLRTAEERRSLYELARLVGYRPRPGVAADVHLAFEVEAPPTVTTAVGLTTPGTTPPDPDVEILIPAGTQAKSTPTPGTEETPQVFETTADFRARPGWNAMRLATTRPYSLDSGGVTSLETLMCRGVGLRLSTNDILVFSFGDRLHLPRRVVEVREDPSKQLTEVQFSRRAISQEHFRRDLTEAVAAYLDGASRRYPGETMLLQELTRLSDQVLLRITNGEFDTTNSPTPIRPVDTPLGIMAMDAAIVAVAGDNELFEKVGSDRASDVTKVIEALKVDLRDGFLLKTARERFQAVQPFLPRLKRIAALPAPDVAPWKARHHLVRALFAAASPSSDSEVLLCSSADAEIAAAIRSTTLDQLVLLDPATETSRVSITVEISNSTLDASNVPVCSLDVEGNAIQVHTVECTAIEINDTLKNLEIKVKDGFTHSARCRVELRVSDLSALASAGSASTGFALIFSSNSPVPNPQAIRLNIAVDRTSYLGLVEVAPRQVLPLTFTRGLEISGTSSEESAQFLLHWELASASRPDAIVVPDQTEWMSLKDLQQSIAEGITLSLKQEGTVTRKPSIATVRLTLKQRTDPSGEIVELDQLLRQIVVQDTDAQDEAASLMRGLLESASESHFSDAKVLSCNRVLRDKSRLLHSTLKEIDTTPARAAVVESVSASNLTATIAAAVVEEMKRPWDRLREHLRSQLRFDEQRLIDSAAVEANSWRGFAERDLVRRIQHLDDPAAAYRAFQTALLPILNSAQPTTAAEVDAIVRTLAEAVTAGAQIGDRERQELVDALGRVALRQRSQTLKALEERLHTYPDQSQPALSRLAEWCTQLSVLLSTLADGMEAAHKLLEIRSDEGAEQLEGTFDDFRDRFEIGDKKFGVGFRNEGERPAIYEWIDGNWSADAVSAPLVGILNPSFAATDHADLARTIHNRLDAGLIALVHRIVLEPRDEVVADRWWQQLDATDFDPDLPTLPNSTSDQSEQQGVIAATLREMGAFFVQDLPIGNSSNVDGRELALALSEFRRLILGAPRNLRTRDSEFDSAVRRYSDLLPQLIGAMSQSEQDALLEVLRQYRHEPAGTEPLTVSVLRTKARVFGWNAPPQVSAGSMTAPLFARIKDQAVTGACGRNDDECRTDAARAIDLMIAGDLQDQLFLPVTPVTAGAEGESSNTLYLEGAIDSIKISSPVYVDPTWSRPAAGGIHVPNSSGQVLGALAVKTRPRTVYGLSGETTEIELDREWWQPATDDFVPIRQTRVHCGAEALMVADEPLTSQVIPVDSTGNERQLLELNGLYSGLHTGKRLILTGIPEEFTSQSIRTRSEEIEIESVEFRLSAETMGATFRTVITLIAPLQNSYIRSSVVIYGNVVPATQGETHREILGSGRGARELEAFRLKSRPLTHVAAPTHTGVRPELMLTVNDQQFELQPDLLRSAPTDPHFAIAINQDGDTRIQFGDGEHGVRLPTGEANIRAVYRSGLGAAGNVAANRIDQLAGPVLGLKGVLNPLAATGGTDPDADATIRERVPVGLSALDRIVSIGDAVDFAEQYAGVLRADASWSGGTITLTAAGFAPVPLAADHRILESLREALRQFSGDQQPFQVLPHTAVLINIEARVAIRSGRAWDQVERELRAQLIERFAYRHARFRRRTASADAIAELQRHPAVLYVDLNAFHAIRESDLEGPVAGRVTPPDANADAGNVDNELGIRRSDIDEVVANGPWLDPTGRSRGAELCFISPEVRDTIQLALIEEVRR